MDLFFASERRHVLVILAVAGALALCTQWLSHDASVYTTPVPGKSVPKLHASYLSFENYLLMTLTVIAGLYYLATMLVLAARSLMPAWQSLLVVGASILLGAVLTPIVLGWTYYQDYVGVHADRFIAVLTLLVVLANGIALKFLTFTEPNRVTVPALTS
jgi:hypothetical protein